LIFCFVCFSFFVKAVMIGKKRAIIENYYFG
jgi:hypothetical protein